MSITVWRCTLWRGFSSCVLYDGNGEGIIWTLGTYHIIMLDGIQETNYACFGSWTIFLNIQKITTRIFCVYKKFSHADVDVKIIFYIYSTYDWVSLIIFYLWHLVGRWRPWSVTLIVFYVLEHRRSLVKTATVLNKLYNYNQQLQRTRNVLISNTLYNN